MICRNVSAAPLSRLFQLNLPHSGSRFTEKLQVCAESLLKIAAISFLWLVACPISLFAQLDMNHDTGVKPEETYDRANENVNIAEGNLNTVIPLAQLPGRNGHGFTLSLTYNSQQWTPSASYQNPGLNVDTIYIGWSNEQPWQINLPVLYMTGVAQTSGVLGSSLYSQQECWQDFALVMGDGSRYAFPNAVADCWQTTTYSNGSYGYAYETNPFQEIERLIDTDGSTGNSGGGGAVSSNIQHALLDLTNFANNIATVRLTDGSQIVFSLDNNGLSPSPNGPIRMLASALVDANGNVTTITENGNNLIISDANNNSLTLNQIDADYIPQSIQYRNSSGQQQTILLNTQVQTSTTRPPTPLFAAPAIAGNIAGGGTSVNSPDVNNIVLPTGLSYTFQYNEYGELLKITYPSGGYTRYDYQASPYAYYVWNSSNEGYADRRDVVAKHVCRAAVTPAGATSPSGYVGSVAPNSCPVTEDNTIYVRTPTYQNTAVTVTDPLGNQTSYQFNAYVPVYPPSLTPGTLVNMGASSILLETSHTTYQGTSTPLSEVDTAYVDPNTGNSTDQPFSKTTILFPSGLHSKVEWTRDYSIKSYTGSVLDRGVETDTHYQIQTGNVLEERDYNFGNGTPGPLLRKIDSTWMTTNPVNSADYQSSAIFMLDKQQSETIYDGSGQIAQTQYEYDNYVGGMTPSGAVQHGIPTNSFGTTYSTRGNLTAVTRWRNTDGALLANRNYQFDDAGNVLIKTDAAGNQTKYSYADVWNDATCAPTGGNSAAYPTKVTNALGQSTQLTYNSCTGTLATSKDPNLQTTSFGYDVMDRKVLVGYPDAGQSCVQYSDAPNSLCPAYSGPTLPIQIVSSQKLTSSVSKVSTIVLDGLSRKIQDQINSDPWGTDYADTTYDGLGNVSSVSNPYRSKSDTTYGITSYTYDALGRKAIQTQPDGSTLQWCFDDIAAVGQSNCSSQSGGASAGTWVDFTDEVGVHWQRTSDALGRLTDVSEPGDLKTRYSYDGLGNLWGVTQSGVPGETARTRSFTYDSLSRLLCASNPENSSAQCPATATAALPVGVVGYVYDVNGNLKTKTDARNISISYGYDTIDRLTSKTYSGDVQSTPSSCYLYDSDSNSGINTIGRLVSEWTQSTSCSTGATGVPSGALSWTNGISYDPMGRLKTSLSVLGTLLVGGFANL